MNIRFSKKFFNSTLASALIISGLTSCALHTASAAQEEVVAKSPANERAALVQEIDTFFNDPRFESAFWGAKIESLDTGEVWYERNANKLFMPASNQKIPTTAAALLILGPDFKFSTKLFGTGEVEDGVLKGDLVVWSNGDPTHYTRFGGKPTDTFVKFAEQLKAKGITKIEGNLIGDDNAFDDNHLGSGWSYDGLDAWWSAPVGALQINENYVDLQITPPTTADGTTTITPNLASDYFTIVNEVETVTEGRTSISVNRPQEGNTIYVTGRAVVGSNGFENSPALLDPTGFYIKVLEETLEANGIEITGSPVDIDDLSSDQVAKLESSRKLLVEDESEPLSEVAKVLMKRSQNLYAETMPRVVAWKETGDGSFRAGTNLIKDKLSEFGVDPDSYIYRDGSGLTRYNFIAPNHLVSILKGMTTTDIYDVWYETMPIAGVDGTLRNRMKGTAAEGNVHAKTGTISNTRGLSGYVTTAGGEKMVFSFLVNAHNTSSKATEDVTDGVLALIASYGADASE